MIKKNTLPQQTFQHPSPSKTTTPHCFPSQDRKASSAMPRPLIKHKRNTLLILAPNPIKTHSPASSKEKIKQVDTARLETTPPRIL